MTQLDFVNSIVKAAAGQGIIEVNRNGDRQLNFGQKSLTEDHLRRIYQDVVRKKGIYSREDINTLFDKSRPCAIRPFFELAVKAGLCTEKSASGRTVFEFSSVILEAVGAA